MAMSDDARIEREQALPSPAHNPDIQEALSLRYSDNAIVVLQLRSGNFAIFNNTRELCGVVESLDRWPPTCWHTPPLARVVTLFQPKPSASKARIDLKELGLS